MKALVQDSYGGPEVLELRDVPPPRIGTDEALVRVRACALNAADWHTLRADPWPVRFVIGMTRPKVPSPGSDVAGVVEAVGTGVTTVQIGDRVIAEATRGGLAELVAVPASRLTPAPASLSDEQAASLPIAGQTALQAVRRAGRLQRGERVLVIGASGGVGHFAVQIAAALGGEVTGVTSTRNLDLVAALGAVHLVDYLTQDVTALGETYDVVVDAVGTLAPDACVALLRPGGRYVGVALGPKPGVTTVITRSLALRRRSKGGLTLGVLTQKGNPEDAATLSAMADAGELRPHIERTYALVDGAEAMRHLESGRVRGKIAVLV